MQIPIQWIWGGAKDSNRFSDDVNAASPWTTSSINYLLLILIILGCISISILPSFYNKSL